MLRPHVSFVHLLLGESSYCCSKYEFDTKGKEGAAKVKLCTPLAVAAEIGNLPTSMIVGVVSRI